MACNAGPKIVNDGLVLAVDAASTKSYPGIGTDWYDRSGNGNDGTLTNGPTYEQKKLGPNNSGLVFLDGVDDELTIAYNSNLKLTQNNDWTVEFWMNAKASNQSASSNCGIWHQDVSVSYTGILISTGTNGNVLFTSSTTGSSWAYLFQNMGSFTDDVWNHVALTKSGSTVRGFVNGSLNLTITSFPPASFFDTSDPTIGAYGGTRFNGYLSNLRLIKGTALYTSSFTPPTAPLTAVTNTTLLTCQGGTSVVDASSSNHTITNVGGVQTADSFFDSIVFDGTDDYVTTGNTLTDADELFADTGRAWSASSWFNVDVISTTEKMILSREGGIGLFNNNYAVWVDTASLKVKLRGGTNKTISNSIAANTWYNVVVTWDGTTANGYLNGKFITTIAVGAQSIGTDNFAIGVGDNLSDDPFDGRISQVLVYNRALTAAEVKQNYNAHRKRYEI